MIGEPPVDYIAKTLARLDPDGTIRTRLTKGEAQPASPSTSAHTPFTDPARVLNRARKHLAKIPGGMQGSNGSKPTLYAARVLVRGYLLDPGTALGLLLSDYNPKCDPPWTVRELEHKVEDAQSKPFNKPEGWLLNATRERPANAHPSRPAPPPTANPVGHPTPMTNAFKPGLPSIVQQPAQLRDVVDEAIAALVAANEPMTTFVHGDLLVKIDTSQRVAAVKSLSKSQLRLLLSNAANFVTENNTKEGETITKATFPKGEAVESIQDHGAWPGLPRLIGVADVPVITAESGLLTRPGYDAASGMYLLPGGYAGVKPVKDSPTCRDVEMARELLMDDLLGDFPFAEDGSRANMLALFLLPFVRGLIDGPTPLHHIDAPQEGTGKSLLAEVWGHVAFGRELPSFGEVSRPDDWQKLLLASLIESPPAIFLDNINGTLDSGTFASALTSPAVSGRLLGFSRIVTAPVRCVWLSSGNNVRMSKELVRRTVYIRIDSKRETAWVGREYRHALPGWAKLNRGDLVWACLTICQAWIAAGKPRGRELLGKFESWSAVIDGILSNAGVCGLLGNQTDFRNATSESSDEWRPFVKAWWGLYGSSKVTAGDLARLAEDKEMLVGLLDDAKSDRGRSKRVSDGMKKQRDRVYGSLRIQLAGTNYRDQMLYQLIDLNGDTPRSEGQEGSADELWL